MKRQLMALGLASVLTVPTWLTAAYPIDASAKKVTVPKKVKAVTSKIKAINPKKSNYIKQTQLANSAYNKLSKKDRLKVTNRKTLTKHVKAIAPTVKKVSKLKKDAAKLSKSTYMTAAPRLLKTYNGLNRAGKAYTPASTVKKINYYNSINKTNTTFKKLTKSSETTLPTLNDAAAINDFILAYEKLSDNQKRILGGSQEAIDYLLQLKPLVKKAVDFDAKYKKLDPTNNAYLKQAYDLNLEYDDGKESISVIVKGTPTILTLAKFTKSHGEITSIPTSKIKQEIDLKDAFEKAVNALPGTGDQYKLVKNAVTAYKNINRDTSDGKKLLGMPITIVDKAALATYKKYEAIPTVVEALQSLPDYDSKNNLSTEDHTALKGAGYTQAQIDTIYNQGLIKSEEVITNLDLAIKSYKKLGGDQKDIVKQKLTSLSLNYLQDAAAIKKGQGMTKAYSAALKKTDLAGMIKEADAYHDLVKKNDLAIRYTSEAPVISVARGTYKTQIGHVTEFEKKMESYSSLTDLKAIQDAYKTIEKDKPSGTKMIASKYVKDYKLIESMIDIKKKMAKVTDPYSTKELNAILDSVKLYAKLDQPKKELVDSFEPRVENFVTEVENIKAAMAVDQKYLALRPSSKNYTKDAKATYNMYLDANANVKKYLVNEIGIKGLPNTYKTPQDKADAFEDAVNRVYKEVYTNVITDAETMNNLKNVKNTYENDIKPYSKINNLVEADVLKKYKQLMPIIDVYNQIFYLKPTPKTEKERENILTAIKAYNKLDKFGKDVIKIEDKLRVNLPLLGDETEINEAKKIDAAYKRIPISDPAYEKKVFEVYLTYRKALPDVQKYVLKSSVLIAASTKYSDVIKAADTFENALKTINSTSRIIDIHKLKEIYEKNKKLYPILDQFIDPKNLMLYKSYLDLLLIQDVAQTVFDQREINGKWIKYDHWFYAYSQSQDKAQFVRNMRKALLISKDASAVQFSIINNSPNYESYSGMLELPNGQNKPIYGANGVIIGYDPEPGFKGEYKRDEVIYNPIDWLNETQIQNLLRAMEYEKRFNALKPGNRTYAREGVALYNDLNKEGIPVKMYFLYNPQLEQIQKLYGDALKNVDKFEALVKALDPKTATLTEVAKLKTAYNELNDVALTLVDSSILKKYQSYIATEEVAVKYRNLSETNKTMENNANILDFISVYNKLTADAKNIVQNELKNPSWLTTLLADEKEIKAAQAVDKKYETLDPKKDNYEAEVIKLVVEYDKLQDTTKKNYSVYSAELDKFKEIYGDEIASSTEKDKNPKITADNFTKMVNKLDSDSKYTEVEAAYELYVFLSVPQTYKDSPKKVVGLNFVDKAVITKYLQYEGLVKIKQAFDTVKDMNAKNFSVKEKDAILASIAAHKKLSRDPKTIFNNDPVFGAIESSTPEKEKRYLVLATEDIKYAEEADKRFEKIKKGSTSFVKDMIYAMKYYNGMTEFQKKFFTQTTLYNTYKKYDKASVIKGEVNTIPEAVLSIVNFEDAVRAAMEIHDKINQSEEIESKWYTEIMEQIVIAYKQYDFLNREFTIEGQKVRLLEMVSNSIRSDYVILKNAYDVNEYLNGLKKQ
ncbi:hypothetical protein KZO01_18090 [Kurthia zopfii]|uniref:Uncharacterized protein n=1 Tax=Kurthia zopfii TaxID=1650 RepID=A0A8B4Q8H0_9BACL|nr:hypothetical protein [Kurthia zopfii]PWI22628.1 hypothetical protein DF281_06125 [Kurthia zopfii]TDR39270.1 hypothetical protein DFR61_11245 [Kurthia zopfii]GEK31500.1 hypothetical protein KZO01_18090 [Kurthia zopfii]STX08815.1 Uncharacterised protein [Kurthia zopfii]